ncbi:hypothetical protein TNCT_738891 [Trichonephila clavata]|uniref:Uncharacterized protein n=1 Tax=Trichonephila clavata TaxID=2740835 RepID=A0A8X6I185_TRICU|nr:hypothetical protein TNCT_738891 [Trichonephila clavata]
MRDRKKKSEKKRGLSNKKALTTGAKIKSLFESSSQAEIKKNRLPANISNKQQTIKGKRGDKKEDDARSKVFRVKSFAYRCGNCVGKKLHRNAMIEAKRGGEERELIAFYIECAFFNSVCVCGCF